MHRPRIEQELHEEAVITDQLLTHGLLKLEDGTLVLSRRVIACRVDFNHNLKKKGQSIER
jgi:hypothetical protein